MWGVVRGDETNGVGAGLPTLQGRPRHSHGMDVLTSDAAAARRALGDTVVVERASFEDIVSSSSREVDHA